MMSKLTALKPALLIALTICGATLLSGAASAQRDPAYQSARESGVIGEMPDGYLGFVGTPTPEIEALVSEINIMRKRAYTKSAEESGTTIDKFAEATGCNLILKTVPGERYMAPNKTWQTRGNGPPARDPSCP